MIGFVVCLHGNERIGLRLMNELDYKYPFIIGNPKALEKNVRFINADLNRTFKYYKHYCSELNMIQDILNFKENKDLIIDIHSAQTDFPLCAIITRHDDKMIEYIESLGIERIIDLSKLSDGGALIDNVRGFSLEVGKDDSKESLNQLTKCFNNPQKVTAKRYEYIGKFKFTGDVIAENMKLVKARYSVAVDTIKNKVYYADQDFYPMSDPAYEGYLLMLREVRNIV